MIIPRQKDALSQEQTIAAIYETMLRSELCDRFLQPSEGGTPGFSDAELVSHQPSLRTDRDLQVHFDRAIEILEQLWGRSGQPEPAEFFESSDNYWILLTSTGRVSRASQLARQSLQGAETDVAAALGLSSAAQDRIEQRLTQLRQQQSWGPAPEIVATADSSRKLMCRPVLSGQGLQTSYGLMIEALDFQWSNRAKDMLAATFGLHQQEIQLLSGLLEGKSLSELGSPTRGGVSSLNAQLQVIMVKSGAPGLAEMLRLFCFLIAEVDADERIANGEAKPSEGQVDIGGDQCLQFFKLGAETGQPVIFIHGLVDGIAGVQRLQMQFRTGGFRVYAPLRCGYGRSGPVPGPEQNIDVFIDQLETLIERENLRRPILLGHRGGGAFAHIAARRLRDRVAGAVIVSGMGPVQKLGQLSGLKDYHWLMAIAATYCPKVLPLVMKLWARSIRQNGPMVLVEQKSRLGHNNSNLKNDPHLATLLQASHNLSLRQGNVGLMADFHLVVNDWRRHIDGHSAPVIYLHGDGDQITSVDRLQRTMAGRSNVQVRLCRDAGAMLLYSRPELVLAALEELSEA